ncbi:MAG: protein kinase [Myxococcales bacterium]|nr:protein kinase [Myxococcales bacterium]MCB9713502.1 protein kinase [Myxococcales bacterium]
MPSLAGTQIDKYDMIEEVGHGGMAVVYRGLDRVLKREVAIKVLHPHLADRKESRLRLEREAIAVAKLRHENILEIFDYSGPEAAESYIVTEFIHGVTLRDWVDERLDPRPAVAAMIVHRLCLALQHAHSGGIVHRDIKPENVMIREDGVLKLMDFGIAQIIDNQKLTLTGQLIGSPAYMAPELISGRPLDHRTDLFSLGILLYQLATGRLPFTGRNPHEVLNRIADGDYPPAVTICPLVDRDLEDIIALSLASDPDERYQTVEHLGRDLAAYLEEMGIEPSNAELGAYFRDPEHYVVELDRRVCEALTERASEAASAGETARAIRMLGRVLELDARHPGATTLLERLRKRERRNRRLLVVAVGAGAVGLVVALAQLMPPAAPLDERETTATASHASSLDRADPSAGSVAAGGLAADDLAEDEDGSTGGPITTAAGSDTAAEPAATGEAGPDPTGAEVPTPNPDERIRRRPVGTTNPPREPVTTPCTLAFTGIPLPTAQNLSVTVGTKTMGIEAMEMQVELPGTESSVRIKDSRYVASRTVTRAQCEAGPVPVEIRPKPAKVKFEGVADDVVVLCKAGCRADLNGTNQTVKTFQSVPIEKGRLQQTVTLLLKHADFEPKTIEEDLLPGPNVIRVSLIPRKP